MNGSYWNHNVHYEPVILRAAPPGCESALDVGCGDGHLVRRLAGRCAMVTGIDVDAPIVGQARKQCGGNAVIIHGDFLSYPFKEETFDFVCANTVLHHVDLAPALTRLAGLLRPGGTLAVVGLARNASPWDYARDCVAIPTNWWYRLRLHQVQSGAPVKEPATTWREVRDTAGETLPGVRYSRHLLWRYSLLWRKPALRLISVARGLHPGPPVTAKLPPTCDPPASPVTLCLRSDREIPALRTRNGRRAYKAGDLSVPDYSICSPKRR
jgi:SAM-dependent methyltransferase